MKTLAAIILVVMFAACGDGGAALSPSPAGHPTALRITPGERTHTSSAYSVLYSFQGHDDGRDAHGGPPVEIRGMLYSTTEYGGGVCHARCFGGTVFSITTTGSEKVLHSFETSPKDDGKNPRSGLTDGAGILYGNTVNGGNASCYCGTVFEVTLSGTETVLHNFTGEPDGYGPDESSLLDVNGTLYGTTASGGTSNNGTVYAVTTSGKETVVHSFAGAPDGANPKATLININGTLYGTTYYGGANCGSHGGCGTVFTLTPSGAEAVLYSFKGGSDGEYPAQEALLDVNGTLYGTTKRGGSHNLGTVFSITTSGTEAVLHSFGGSGDGIYPYGGLIDVKGTLYGTTSNGGTVKCGVRYGGIPGCGTVFLVTTSGNEAVLHSFGNAGDGDYPYGGLIDLKGTLYGTTTAGGTHNAGIVFSLLP